MKKKTYMLYIKLKYYLVHFTKYEPYLILNEDESAHGAVLL